MGLKTEKADIVHWAPGKKVSFLALNGTMVGVVFGHPKIPICSNTKAATATNLADVTCVNCRKRLNKLVSCHNSLVFTARRLVHLKAPTNMAPFNLPAKMGWG